MRQEVFQNRSQIKYNIIARVVFTYLLLLIFSKMFAEWMYSDIIGVHRYRSSNEIPNHVEKTNETNE